MPRDGEAEREFDRDNGLEPAEAVVGNGPAAGKTRHSTGANQNRKQRAELLRELAERNGIAPPPSTPRPVPQRAVGVLEVPTGFPRGANIVQQGWIDGAGLRYAVAKKDGLFVGCWADERGLGHRLPCLTPRDTFPVAQQDLDHYAGRIKHWRPDPPIDAEGASDPPPDPAPVRKGEERAGRKNVDSSPEDLVSLDGTYAVRLDVRLVDPGPFQPRSVFDEEKLRSLADDIRRFGQRQPAIVRPKGDRYEVVDGERRLRACILAGLKTLLAFVQDVSDAEARRLPIALSEHSEPLNPIELARAYRRLVESGDAKTDAEAAAMVHVSQGQFSNVVGLLKLPKDLQAKIISQEMTTTQARSLTTYAEKCPHLLPAIIKRLGQRPADCSTQEFRQRLAQALEQVTKPMTGSVRRPGKGYKYDAVFAPTAGDREQLGLVKCPRLFGGGEVLGATNVKLWERLQREHVAAIVAKWEGRGKGATSGRQNAKGEAKGEKPLSEAQRKIQAKREARRRADQARLAARRVWGWKTCRLREAAAARVGCMGADKGARVQLYLFVSSSTWSMGATSSQFYARRRDREDILARILDKTPGKSPWPAIAALGDGWAGKHADQVAAAILWDAKRRTPQIDIPDDDVLGIAACLEVDLAALWKTDQKGQWGKEYLELHTREQLAALGEELGVYVDAGKDKATMVRLLQGSPKTLRLPKELARAKKPQ